MERILSQTQCEHVVEDATSGLRVKENEQLQVTIHDEK